MAAKPDGDLIRVRHMLDATRESLEFIQNKHREDLNCDRMLTLALIKQLELIGEAAARVSQEFQQQHPTVPWKVIIATRNRLVHGYFDIDLDIVWKTVNEDLRELLKLLAVVLRTKAK